MTDGELRSSGSRVRAHPESGRRPRFHFVSAGVTGLLVAAFALGLSVPPASAKSPTLGAAVPSTIEGLPVPAVAKLDPKLHSNGGAFGGMGDGYQLPKGVTASALKSWYATVLPTRAPYRGWTWCGTVSTKTALQWSWLHPGTKDLLYITLVFEKPPTPLGILVRIDESGPCS